MPVAGPSDSWDDPPTEPRLSVPAGRRDEPVPDDWDNADDDEDDDPTKVWENENQKAPMPEVVIASSATSASTISPPPAAFQPSIRILKRPSAMSNGQPVTPQTNAQQKSFVQREVDYQLARDRIFGESSGRAETVASTVVKHDPSGSPTPRDAPGCLPPRNATPPTAKIIRNPRGPDTSPNGSKMTPVKGFKNRRPKEFQSSKETRPS